MPLVCYRARGCSCFVVSSLVQSSSVIVAIHSHHHLSSSLSIVVYHRRCLLSFVTIRHRPSQFRSTFVSFRLMSINVRPSGPFCPLTFIYHHSSPSTRYIFQIICTAYICIRYRIFQTICTYSSRSYIGFKN